MYLKNKGVHIHDREKRKINLSIEFSLWGILRDILLIIAAIKIITMTRI